MFSGDTGHLVRLLFAGLMVAALTACQSAGDKVRLEAPTLEERETRTRRLEDVSEQLVLGACVSSLQDLGFQIEEADSQLGVIVGSKRRDATSRSEVVGAVLLTLIFGAAPPIDDEQIIRVSLSAWPDSNRDDTTWRVRATFQRSILNTQGVATTLETIEDSELYQQFFERLIQALYLEREAIT